LNPTSGDFDLNDAYRWFSTCRRLLLGCFLTLVIPASVSGANIQNKDLQTLDQGMETGQNNITQYDDSLRQLGAMLEAYGCSKTLIQVRGIYNRTASEKLPADVSQLTITALNKIGKLVQVVDYDQDQLGIDLAIGTQTMDRIIPDLALRGAITEFDKKIEKERGVGVDLAADTFGIDSDTGADASYNTSSDGTTTAMDFQLIDYKSQTLIPGVQAANRINVFNTTQGKGAKLSIIGSGAKIDARVKESQGLHASLRLLVELSITELIGKYHKVPYWRCLPNADPDLDMIRSYRNQIAQDGEHAVFILKELALAHGYAMDPLSNQLSEPEMQVLEKMRKNLGLALEISDVDCITELWLTLPLEPESRRMHEIRFQRQQEEMAQQQAHAAQEQLAQQQLSEAQAIEAEKHEQRTTFKFGKQDSF
jgi:hypothetical protein